MFKRRIRVIGRMRMRREFGYIDLADHYENLLVRETMFLGLVIRRLILDSEHVPGCAIISNGCFGDTGGFVSKFAPFDKYGNIQK